MGWGKEGSGKKIIVRRVERIADKKNGCGETYIPDSRVCKHGSRRHKKGEYRYAYSLFWWLKQKLQQCKSFA